MLRDCVDFTAHFSDFGVHLFHNFAKSSLIKGAYIRTYEGIARNNAMCFIVSGMAHPNCQYFVDPLADKTFIIRRYFSNHIYKSHT